MFGMDQIVVIMWFLPVILFIVMPLCIGTVWLPIALMIRAFRGEPVAQRQAEAVGK